jgi:RNA polymerase sigma-70 factor (ECF subfamily)
MNPLTAWTELELVERARDRDAEAFAELMRRNSSPSMRLALSVLKDRQDAEDEVQNAFLKAWRALATFQFESKFSTWFRTIVLNQSLMRLRSARRARFAYLDDEAEEAGPIELTDHGRTPEESLASKELAAHLEREIERLPARLRQVLLLRDFDQLSTEEVAARLSISEPAAKSRLARARTMLRQRMQRHATERESLAT